MNELFQEWEKAYRENGIEAKFVKDGIVNEEYYKNIVWILKETNDYEGALNELVNDRVINNKKSMMWRGVTWHNIGRGTAKLLNPDLDIKEADKIWKKSLLHIAVMNIKKTTGKASSDWDEIFEFAKNYSEFIIKELELLNPKIVVLGGTKDALKNILSLQHQNKNIYSSEKFPNTIFIEAYHPAARKKKIEYFNQF